MMNSKTLFTALLLVVGTPIKVVESWSFQSSHNGNSNINSNDAVSTRRGLFQQSAKAALTASGMTTAFFTSPSASNAACLQGDLRPVCIGIYKVPLDENILPYISTPEELHKYAPDLTYVPPIETPKSFESAMAILRQQRAAADEIKTVVMAGRLEEAGIQVLGLIPQVTSSSRRVFSDLEAKIRTEGILGTKQSRNGNNDDELNNENDDSTTVEALAIEMAEDQMNYVNGYWGDCDITIGQGIRGELGKVTVAQLTILESLRDATCAMDDYLVTASTLSKASV